MILLVDNPLLLTYLQDQATMYDPINLLFINESSVFVI